MVFSSPVSFVDSSPLPWTDMFHAAASSPSPSPSLHQLLGFSASPLSPPNQEPNASAPTMPLPPQASLSREIEEQKPFLDSSCSDLVLDKKPAEEDVSKYSRESFQLALYIAMAHAGLVLMVVVLYVVLRLLEDYWKPIQWAVLCSMPLREIQGALVTFWERPLRQGLVETLLAIPLAICKALIFTILDARAGVHYLLGKSRPGDRRKVGFSTLMRWIVSFALLTLGYDFMGPGPLAIVAFVGMILYAAGTSLGLVVPASGQLEIDASWSILSAEDGQGGRRARSCLRCILSPFIKTYKFLNTRLTRAFLGKLHTLVAIWLIFMMIFGSFAGLILFSYKIGLEGKDAVVALKTHVQATNYAELAGLKQWIEDSRIPDLIDTYTAKAYDTVSQQIDFFAAQYNITDLADATKQYILRFAQGQNAYLSPPAAPAHPVLQRLLSVQIKLRELDVKGIYLELEQAAYFFLEHFQISREELIEKAKLAGERCLNVGKKVMERSSSLIMESTNFLFSISSSIASGGMEIVNFFAQALVFFYVLFYLITSRTGGVMEHVLGMVPLTESTRRRCATVLDHTVSSVLLATAKAAFFQASFTWLLFWFFNIHFLYMSTMLALLNAALPIFPGWWSSLPAGAQLAMDGHYLQAILLMATHMWIMDYGVSAIQHGIPGYNAYLTGLSIAGGMALFSPALEGAIMGPLLMTVLISLKNLYSELVLTTTNKK